MYLFLINVLCFNLFIVIISEVSLACLFGAKRLKDIITVVLVNILTNPPLVLWGVSMAMFFNNYERIFIYIMEIFVLWLEGFIYYKCKTFGSKNAYLISSVLNVTSFALGELIKIFM